MRVQFASPTDPHTFRPLFQLSCLTLFLISTFSHSQVPLEELLDDLEGLGIGEDEEGADDGDDEMMEDA